MYKPKNDFLDPQTPCAVCGGQEFEWGRLAGQVYYIPSANLWRRKGRQVIKIRRCLQCNNLLQFSDDELTRQQNRAMVVVLIIVFAVMSVVVCLSLLPALLLTTH
jgi:hypothetical protein